MFSSIGAYDFVTEQRVIEDVAIELLPLAKDILDCHPCRHLGIRDTYTETARNNKMSGLLNTLPCYYLSLLVIQLAHLAVTIP